MSRRVSLRAKVSGISIRAAIRLSDGARRAAPVMLLIGVLFAGAAVWLTASAKASHWVWKGWERMFGPQSLTGATPRVFAQLGGSGNYTISSIDEPSAGTSPMEGTLVSAVNASGAMTGAYSDQTGVAHGFVYANGTFTSFDAPNAGSTPQAGWFQGTMGVGIDTAGDVVGVYADSNNAYHGFLLPANSTTPIEFDDPDAPTTTSERGTFPMGINDNGQIVGFYTTCCYNTTSAYYGFLLAAGNFAPGNFTASANYTTIMAPGAGTGETANGVKEGTTPLALNASGVVTGYYVDANGNRHGFIYNSATTAFTNPQIDGPGATTNTGHGGSFSGTVPMSIDAAGDVVGSWTDSSQVRHGFILPAGATRAISFDAPGANTSSQSGTLGGTFPTRIDPTGAYMTGSYTDSSGLGHGFVYYQPLTANGSFSTFTPPNQTTSTSGLPIQGGVLGVNASGTVVGFYLDSSAVAHGFVYTTTQIPTPAPTFSPAPGTYGSVQTVTISDANPAATIYYTSDGTTPTTSSTPYADPITVSSTETIEAMAASSGHGNSLVVTATFALNLPGGTPAPAPQFSPAGGSYSAAQPVTITDSAPGAMIYYTLDGSAPTDASTLYTAPVTVSVSAVLQAVAIAPDYTPSNIAAASYQIQNTNEPQFVYNVAGTGQTGYNGDGVPATQADVNSSAATATDSAGNVYIADTDNNRIRKVSAATGLISTFAGTGTSGYSGDGGLPTAAELNSPSGLAVDSSGNVYIADTGNSLIREVSQSTGDITTYAGMVVSGEPVYECAAGVNAFGLPRGIAFDSSGDLYVADPACSVVWKVATGTQSVTVFAGEPGRSGYNGDLRPPTQALLNQPLSVALDSSGDVYIADLGNNRVREVEGGDVILTVAGNGNFGSTGDGGPATAAEIEEPFAVALDSSANVYIASLFSIRLVTAQTGVISTFAGESGVSTSNTDGALPIANLLFPESLSFGSNSALYFYDAYSGRVRMVSALAPAPSTAAAAPVIGLNSGTYSSAQTVTISDTTPGATIYFTLDGSTPTGSSPIYHGSVVVTGTSTLNAIAIAPGFVSSAPASASYTITPAPSTLISTIATAESTVGLEEDACFGGVALDSANDIYAIDTCGNYPVVFKISAATGKATLFAGIGSYGYAGDGGQAADAEFAFTNNSGIAVDSSGNVYVADTYNNRVRVINASTGVITTFAGTGAYGYSGDSGAATSAELAFPMGLAIDAQGNLYIADSNNCIVRIVNLQTGIINTFAGTPETYGDGGDNGPATSATLEYPQTVAVDSASNLYIADQSNKIRKVTKTTGIITTIAGSGQYGATGDGGPALNAQMIPGFLAADAQGDVYVSNLGDGVREVSAATGNISTVVGDGYQGYWGDGGPPTNAGLSFPAGIAFDSSGDIIVADTDNENIRAVAPSVAAPTFSPAAATYTAAQTVTISDSTRGATIYYTTNGTTPTITPSEEYSTALTIAKTTTVEALAATVYGYSPSAVASATYTILLAQTITFTQPASPVTYGVSPVTLVASGGASGNPVIFSVVSGPAKVSGTNGATLTITGPGTVVV
ncbi:MAG: chitobiase/beta-hexosaminidase C-terminal domain-containing protein, partial [Terracidiphilus sp.]